MMAYAKRMRLAAAFALVVGGVTMCAAPVAAQQQLGQNTGQVYGSANVAIMFNDRSSPVFDLTNNGVITSEIVESRFDSMRACERHMNNAFNTLVSRIPRYEEFYERAFGRNIDGKIGVSVRASCSDSRTGQVLRLRGEHNL